MVQIESECFSLHKAGNGKDEYEDAFHTGITVSKDVAYHRFAIADGASESSFADIWADLLASAYCHGQWGRHPIDKSIAKLSKAWRRKLHPGELPWYAQEKLSNGAFSTLAGITFLLTDASSAVFHAAAIGDSCIFHIRGDKIIAFFPLGSIDDFHNRPVLISSNAANNHQLKASLKQWSGTADAGDSFLLMTDALACWFLTRYEENMSVIKKVHGLASERDFIDLVQSERKLISRNGGCYLRNDDVTLIRVNLFKGK
jgi:hypothetical protein